MIKKTNSWMRKTKDLFLLDETKKYIIAYLEEKNNCILRNSTKKT